MSRHHQTLNRKRWARTRYAVLERDNWRCRKCGKPGILEVDHVVPLNVQPEQDAYDPNGCQVLCRTCHIVKTREENGGPEDPERARWRALVALITEGTG